LQKEGGGRHRTDTSREAEPPIVFKGNGPDGSMGAKTGDANSKKRIIDLLNKKEEKENCLRGNGGGNLSMS